MDDAYRTVARPAVVELEVRRSRFLCAVWPVADRAEAEERIAAWSLRHADATHNVFAFRVGVRSLVEGCADAGEPPGTAGRPALAVLQHLDLRGVALVVTRYFGGVKLGTGGLVRAYGDAARAGVAAAGVVTMVPGWRWRLSVPYPAWEWLTHRLRAMEARLEAPRFAEQGVEVEAWVANGRAAALEDLLERAAGLAVKAEPLGPAFGPAGPDEGGL